jgi:hypothetical protein
MEKAIIKKSWKQRIKDGEKIEDIVFSEPEMNINEWLEKCKKEKLSNKVENQFLRYADRFDKIKFEKVSPEALAKQFKKTVNI